MSDPLTAMREQLRGHLPAILAEGQDTAFVARSPIGLDLLGGDIRRAGGLVVATNAADAVFVAARRAAGDAVVAASGGDPTRVDPPWLAALHRQLLRRAGATTGMRLWIDPQVTPVRSGTLAASHAVAAARAMAAVLGLEPDPDAIIEDTYQALSGSDPFASRAVLRGLVSGTAGSLLPILCQGEQALDRLALPDEIELAVLFTDRSWWSARANHRFCVAVAMAYRVVAERVGMTVHTGERGAPQRIEDPFFDGHFANIDPLTFAANLRDHLPEHVLGEQFLERWGGIADPRLRIDPADTYPVRQAALYVISEHQRACVAIDALARGVRADGQSRARILGAQIEQAYLAERDFEWHTLEAAFLITRLRLRGAERGMLGARSSVAGGPVIALLERNEAGERSLAESIAACEREFGVGVHLRRGTAPGAAATPPQPL